MSPNNKKIVAANTTRHYSKTFAIYDFDHTIYNGNAMVDFYLYAIRHEVRLLKFMPFQLLHAVLFLLKAETRTNFKSNFFIFVRGIDDIDTMVIDFWQQNFKKIRQWYLSQDHKADIIVSASPIFILNEISHKLGVFKLIATELNLKTGKVVGKNCYGAEKLKRLKQEMPDAKFAKCFTDSLSDLPILEIAEEGYIVQGDIIIPFAEYKQSFLRKFS